MPNHITSALCLSAVAFGLAPSLATAAPERFQADYSISLFGLPVASARFASAFDENGRFTIDGTVSSSGIARLFDRTSGTTRASGQVGDRGVVPHSYRVDYMTGGTAKRTSISFADGNVSEAVNLPAPRRRPDTWVPVSQSHLRAVTDPITSTLIRADRPQDVCNRTIQFFDGEMRADLALSQRSINGSTVTCTARFLPVSGYRQGRSQIDYLRDRGRIEISLAPLGGTGIYTPVQASIGTRVGTIQVRATSIQRR